MQYTIPLLELDRDAKPEEIDLHWYRSQMRIEGDSRRGLCIKAVSLIDHLLLQLLNKRLTDNNALGKQIPHAGRQESLVLEKKIKNAHAIGLLTDREAARCHIIRDIRNEFGHEPTASFLIEPVNGLAMKLFDTRLHGPKSGADWVFMCACEQIILNLRKRCREAAVFND